MARFQGLERPHREVGLGQRLTRRQRDGGRPAAAADRAKVRIPLEGPPVRVLARAPAARAQTKVVKIYLNLINLKSI